MVAFVANADTTLVVGQIVHATVDVLVDYGRSLQEGFLYIGSSLCGRLHEDKAVFTRKHFALVRTDLAPRIQVTLVANEHDSHVWVTVLLYFLKPASQMREGVTARYVIDEKSASCTAIVGACDTLEGLLASSVPDLKLNILLSDLDSARAELDTNCQIVLLSESLVRKLE